MKPNQARFESFPWEFEILKLGALFNTIDNFLNDEQTKKRYLDQKDTMFVDDVFGDPSQILLTGVQVFRRQMVVLLKTYLEQIIKDFLINVFIGKPEKAARYILLNEFQSDQSVQELEKILAESKSTTLNELPQNATTKVMKGNLSEILKKIEKISEAKIERHTKDNLIKLNEIRTHIVHETSDKEISIEFLQESLEAIRELIVSLRGVCAINNISDVDDGNEEDGEE